MTRKRLWTSGAGSPHDKNDGPIGADPLPVFDGTVEGPFCFVAPALVGRIAFGGVLCQLDPDPGSLRDEHAAVLEAERLGSSWIPRLGMEAQSWRQAAVDTGPKGLWGITSTSWASAKAQIFLLVVMPPTAQTSGRI